MSRTVPLLLSPLVAALALGCGALDPDAPEPWRFAIEETRGSVQWAYAKRFEELVEERSEGEIDVKVYPYGTLGTSDQITELVHNGSIQFAMASPGHVGKLIPEVQVFLLHFVLSDDERVNNLALADPTLRGLLDDLYAEKGFKALAFYTEGWQAWTTNRPIEAPEDFRGFRMRVMTSPMLMAAYAAYGASATPLPYAEVYSALQLSMIDGQDNPVFAIQEMSFYEVSNYLIFPRHSQFVTSAMTGHAFWDDLSPERQQMVTEIMAELQGYIYEQQVAFNEERLELSPEQQARFRERSLPVRELYGRTGGPRAQEVLAALDAAVERAEAEVAARGEAGTPEE